LFRLTLISEITASTDEVGRHKQHGWIPETLEPGKGDLAERAMAIIEG
jgi:hypothetical protein